jgi:4-hydroxy-tetrahydrodipicolinate synthase
MREYTDLAFRGDTARARAVRDSLNPVREAFRRTRPPGNSTRIRNTGRSCSSQVGGQVRPPMLS